MTLRWRDVKALHEQGMTDAEIAAHLGYSYAYVAQVRKSIELKPNRRKRNVTTNPA